MLALDGFLGTRADFLVDLVLLSFWILPVLLFFSFKLAKKRAYKAHKNIQTAALALVSLMVLLLEADIRFFSLTSAVQKSIFYKDEIFNLFLGVHIIVAVAALAGWIFLVIKSLKSFQKTLPGTFSAVHKRIAIAVFSGLCFTTLSGTLIYAMLFVF